MRKLLLRKSVALVAVTAIGVTLAIPLLRPRPPLYYGRTAEAWLKQAVTPGGLATPDSQSPFDVFSQLGPEAVPQGIKMLGARETWWSRNYQAAYQKLPPFVQNKLRYPVPPALARSVAFLALSDNPHTRGFLPEIAQLLKSPDASVRIQAADLMCSVIQPEDVGVLPQLVAAMSDSQSNVWVGATMALRRLGTNAQAAIPALAPLLAHETPRVRYQAAAAVFDVGVPDSQEKNRLRSLVNDCLFFRTCQPVLGRDEAGLAEELNRTIPNDAGAIGHYSAVILKAIRPGAAEAPRQLEQSLTNRDANIRITAAYSLAGVGQTNRIISDLLAATFQQGRRAEH